MYSLNMPVSSIRTKVRQEFERHRYVSQLKTVDVLLMNSHQEFQVSSRTRREKKVGPSDAIEYVGEVREEEHEYLLGLHGHWKSGGVLLILCSLQETLNFWKQLTHVLKYFRAEEDPQARLPKNFIQGFIEVSTVRHSTRGKD